MLRDATESDFGAIVRLNLESEHFMSAMGLERLRQLHAQSACCRVVDEPGAGVVAFLLAFREGSAYDSENYRWFAGRRDSFLYIDRIAVAKSHQGNGLGKQLYEDLFRFAREHRVPRITCEFDIEPANEVSARFHARFGFREVGSRSVSYADKRVAMQEASSGAMP